jgi:hypothetical protein
MDPTRMALLGALIAVVGGLVAVFATLRAGRARKDGAGSEGGALFRNDRDSDTWSDGGSDGGGGGD